jgi:hypothetical protein
MRAEDRRLGTKESIRPLTTAYYETKNKKEGSRRKIIGRLDYSHANFYRGTLFLYLV